MSEQNADSACATCVRFMPAYQEFRAECVCGWTGSYFKDQRDADVEGIRHVGAVPARRRYRHSKWHYADPNGQRFCPDPDNCAHTTEVEGESCECCGRVVGAHIDCSGASE